MRFVALFAIIALAEMATFFWVGSQIGFGWALGIAVTTAVIGSILVRHAGLSVISRIRQKTSQGQIPGRELSDGAAVLVAGAFLISPGFITDTLGFLLLIPGVRSFVYKRLSSRYMSKWTVFTASQTGASRSGSGEVIDVEGDVIDPRQELGEG